MNPFINYAAIMPADIINSFTIPSFYNALSLLTPGWGQMNVDDKKNRNRRNDINEDAKCRMQLMQNGRGLSLQPQKTEEGLEEQIFQEKPSCLFVLNIIVSSYAWIYKKYQVDTVVRIH